MTKMKMTQPRTQKGTSAKSDFHGTTFDMCAAIFHSSKDRHDKSKLQTIAEHNNRANKWIENVCCVLKCAYTAKLKPICPFKRLRE